MFFRVWTTRAPQPGTPLSAQTNLIDAICFLPNIANLDGGQRKAITFGSKLPRSFHWGPVATAFFGASSGAAERLSCRSGKASATVPGRGDCHRSRGHAATPPTAAGRGRAGRKGGPPGSRIRVWEGVGDEEAGVEMSRSMGVEKRRRLDDRMARGGVATTRRG
jgi:hypothetical protein